MLPLYQQRNLYNNNTTTIISHNNTMAEVNRPKVQLRSALSINGDKTPSPATKLLINHGKPNFTIQKSPKTQNGNANPLSPPVVNSNNNNNNEFVVKSTTFNGIFKPSNISPAVKQTLPPQNGLSNNNNQNSADNEASKVVLRRAKVVNAEVKDGEENENVPEFILRQRRIQERLANQNILDFENRRSGYFTQVMISPSSPNRQSFVETMASPAVKPGLEIPPPAPEKQEEVKEDVTQEQQENGQQQQTDVVEEKNEECVKAEPVTLNGHDVSEEEEVAKAIEEVNKAVEGEDEVEEIEEHHQEEKQETKQEESVAVVTSLAVEEETPKEEEPVVAPVAAVVTSLAVEEEPVKQEESVKQEVSVKKEESIEQEESVKHEESTKAEESSVAKESPKDEETVVETIEVTQQNGHHETVAVVHQTNEEHVQNGHSSHEITISHTNGLNSPTIPSPDPKGEKGVNFEPKTVVSFSQELGNDVNKYPDTVKVVKEVQSPEIDPELKELTKLKFEIKAEDDNIEVKPVLLTEPTAN